MGQLVKYFGCRFNELFEVVLVDPGAGSSAEALSPARAAALLASESHESPQSRRVAHPSKDAVMRLRSAPATDNPAPDRTAGSCLWIRSRSSAGTRTKRCARPSEQAATTAD